MPCVTRARNGRISSGEVGPPKAIRENSLIRKNSLAGHALPCAELVNRFDHGDDVIDRRFGQHAMAQVENMAGPAAGAVRECRRRGS